MSLRKDTRHAVKRKYQSCLGFADPQTPRGVSNYHSDLAEEDRNFQLPADSWLCSSLVICTRNSSVPIESIGLTLFSGRQNQVTLTEGSLYGSAEQRHQVNSQGHSNKDNCVERLEKSICGPQLLPFSRVYVGLVGCPIRVPVDQGIRHATHHRASLPQPSREKCHLSRLKPLQVP